ncbi:MAG TPA: response regulator [Candidatus Limnocylindria bacterium]|nr:response regulator [Candidatus Limnocylindria bacterium]
MSDSPLARLLIVDDEAPQMKALCDTLRDHGYETVGFTNGHAALEALEKSKFDLLLSDLMMPEIDGIALLAAALEKDPDLVGIIMTGQGTIDTAVDAMKTGALDYILKPFKLSAILPVLSRALAVRRLRKEKTDLERSLGQRTAELEVANKELESFSYSVSHDLRAPLRAVDGFSNMLLKQYSAEMPADARDLLKRVSASAQRMNDLIDGLLQFSRLGREPLSKRPVNIAAIVRDALAELRPEQENRQVELQVVELPDCVGDTLLLKQVFVNLLSNAFKFTRHKPKAVIHVGCQPENKENVFFVRDNGAGFEMRYAEKLFGVFQRLHSNDEFEGTGVGLSIVQRIIQRHGGRIWVEAQVDRGATFYFTLNERNENA